MIGKKSVLFAMVFATLGVLLMGALNQPYLSLKPVLHDHSSQLSSSVALGCVGLDLFRKSPQSLFSRIDEETSLSPAAKTDRAFYLNSLGAQPDELFFSPACSQRAFQLVWPKVPRPYGPGIFILLTPLSQLWSQNLFSTAVALTAINWLFLFFSGLSLLLLYTLFQPEKSGFLSRLFFFFVCLESVRWGMNGQMDALAVLFVLLALISIRGLDPARALCFFAVAMFFQFRALYWSPVVIYCIYLQLKQNEFRIGAALNNRFIVVAFLFASVGLGTFAISYLAVMERLGMSITNQIYFRQPTNIAGMYLMIVMTCGGALWLFLKRSIISASMILWMGFMVLTMPFVKPWHILFLAPLLALPQVLPQPPEATQRSLQWPLFLFYLGCAGTVYGNNPFDFNLVREILAHF